MVVNPKTIVLKGCPTPNFEYPASAAITPGHLVAVASTGKVAVHAAAGLATRPLIAVENALIGKGISDAYAADDLVQCVHAQPGDVIYALVAAGAAAIVKGDKLSSAGDGTFKKAVTASQLTSGNYTYTPADVILAEADEAVDNSGGGAAVRIRAIIR
jgi:hypothetical protein